MLALVNIERIKKRGVILKMPRRYLNLWGVMSVRILEI